MAYLIAGIFNSVHTPRSHELSLHLLFSIACATVTAEIQKTVTQYMAH